MIAIALRGDRRLVNRLDRMEEITYVNTIVIQELQQSIAQVTQLQNRSNRRPLQNSDDCPRYKFQIIWD